MIILLTCAPLAQAAAPVAPTIREPSADNAVLSAFDVHMEVTGYADGGGDNDPWACTEFEIRTTGGEVAWRTDPLCKDANHVHFGDGVFVNSHAGRTQLLFDTDYRLFARFRDTAGELSANSSRPFRTAPAPPPGNPSTPWVAKQPGFAVEEVADDFQLPVNVALVPNPGSSPDSPLLYVSELYGSIKTVTRSGSVLTYAHDLLNFDPTGDFPGSGERGVTGLAVDPPTGDVLVSLVYDDPDSDFFWGRVDRLSSTDGGRAASSTETVLDLGIVEPVWSQTPSHQISNLSFAPDGTVFVHQGDSFAPEFAPSDNHYIGKVLRFDPDNCGPALVNPAAPNCAPAPDNPLYNPGNGINATDYLYAKGFRNPFGGTWRASNGDHYVVDNGPNTDRFTRVDFPPSGEDEVPDYEWNGDNEDMLVRALFNWTPSTAPVNVAMVEPGTFGGSGFPAAKMDHAFVTLSGPTYAEGPQELGKRIVELAPGAGGELGGPERDLVVYEGSGRASASGLAAGPDGLYFTDLYKDLGASSPADPGARLLRVRYFPPTTPTTPTCTLNARTLEVSLPGKRKRGKGKKSAEKKPWKTTIRRSGDAITVSGRPQEECGATVDNIDQITVTGKRGTQQVRIDLRGGPFAPGAADELEGEPEIEIGVRLGRGRDTLKILRKRSQFVRANRRRASFNRDDDSDLTARGIERLKVKPGAKRKPKSK